MEARNKRRRVPVQVHTRKIDRLVAKHQMQKRYTRLCESAKNSYGQPTHERSRSKKGANHMASLVREKRSYFAAQWRRYIPA